MNYRPVDLFVAITTKDFKAVKQIVDSGVNLNCVLRGATPLSFAIYRNLNKIIELLICCGADVNARSKDHLSRYEPPLVTACRLNSITIVKLLLNSPKLNIDQKDFFNKSALWVATSHRNIEVVEILLDNFANVNIAQTYTDCPLYFSTYCYRGRKPLAHLLIRRGCQLDLVNHCGQPPLYWAAKHGDREIFELLVRSGCRVKPEKWLSYQNLDTTWRSDDQFCKWIKDIQNNPRDLKDIAACSVRKILTLRWKNLQKEFVDKLQIPESVKERILLVN